MHDRLRFPGTTSLKGGRMWFLDDQGLPVERRVNEAASVRTAAKRRFEKLSAGRSASQRPILRTSHCSDPVGLRLSFMGLRHVCLAGDLSIAGSFYFGRWLLRAPS